MMDDPEVRNKLRGLGYGFIKEREKLFAPYFSDQKRLKIFTDLWMNILMISTEQIIMTNYDILDEEINERFSMFFELV
ncbi:MAG: hypothetical protein K0R31_1320 [Clostridiales bacterium]|jgi:hypothetical protein|nr:hypothetical protein [Clostridiales bacterium]